VTLRGEKPTRRNVWRAWLIFAVVGSVLVSVTVYVLRMPSRPPALVLSVCGAVAPRVQRIAANFGTQFDVPMAEFSIKQGSLDAPPEKVFAVSLKEDGAKMMVAMRDDGFAFGGMKDAFPVFSQHVEEREVRFPDGSIAGRDLSGQLKSGERWRYVTFQAGDAAGYRPAPASDARLFDQVLGSACDAAQ